MFSRCGAPVRLGLHIQLSPGRQVGGWSSSDRPNLVRVRPRNGRSSRDRPLTWSEPLWLDRLSADLDRGASMVVFELQRTEIAERTV